MGKDAVPSIQSLEKPEDLNSLLKQDAGDDCMSCRVIGGGAFLGLSAFNYISGMAQLERRQAEVLKSKSIFGMRSRRAGIAGLSLGLAWMGIWRMMR